MKPNSNNVIVKIRFNIPIFFVFIMQFRIAPHQHELLKYTTTKWKYSVGVTFDIFYQFTLMSLIGELLMLFS